ncbi:MAG: hypothetical protein AAF449_16265 [Myxococcota bacterium]
MSNGGGNISSNPFSAITNLFSGGDGDYNYSGSWRERFGDSLVTDRQRKIHAERKAEADVRRMNVAMRHSAVLKHNVDRAVASDEGRPLAARDVSSVGNVESQFAPRANLQLAAGVPVKV